MSKPILSQRLSSTSFLTHSPLALQLLYISLMSLLLFRNPTPRTMRRSVSTRVSSRPGPSRISSVIIHDTDNGNENERLNVEHSRGHESDSQETAQSAPITPPATRARKAKDQTRLGVGRPVAAGGSGPRPLTKSSSASRGKHAKGSKTTKPTEDTIPEGEYVNCAGAFLS